MAWIKLPLKQSKKMTVTFGPQNGMITFSKSFRDYVNFDLYKSVELYIDIDEKKVGFQFLNTKGRHNISESNQRHISTSSIMNDNMPIWFKKMIRRQKVIDRRFEILIDETVGDPLEDVRYFVQINDKYESEGK